MKADRLWYHSTLGSRVKTRRRSKQEPPRDSALLRIQEMACSRKQGSSLDSTLDFSIVSALLRDTCLATLEATQGQIDGFFSQLPHKCHQNRVACVAD